MKRLLFILIIFSILIGKTFADERITVSAEADDRLITNEAYISIGTVSMVGLLGGIFSSLADSIAEANNENKDDEDEHFEAFSLGLGYNLYLVDFLGLGADGGGEDGEGFHVVFLAAAVFDAGHGVDGFQLEKGSGQVAVTVGILIQIVLMVFFCRIEIPKWQLFDSDRLWI